jgi:hypothetical protein
MRLSALERNRITSTGGLPGMDAQPESANQAGERFAYFMVRIQTNADTRAMASGVVERLGTGRKQSFANIEDLVRLLTEGSGDVQNMRMGTAAGKESTVTAAEPQQVRYVSPNNAVGDK